MLISSIVAASSNNAIGLKGQLLWHLPNDMKFFKDSTWGMPVIMGRKTFDALKKPLAGRTNIVITSNPGWKYDGVWKASNINDAIQQATATNCKELFIIGGGQVYEQSMAVINRIYMTRVHADLNGDAFFPVINETVWELARNVDFEKDEKHAYAYSFQTWNKRGASLNA